MISSVPVSVTKVSRVFLKVPRRKEKQNSVNKVEFFIFFAHKNDSRIYSWTTDVTWTIFNDVLATFLGLERGSCAAVYEGSKSSRMSSKIS